MENDQSPPETTARAWLLAGMMGACYSACLSCAQAEPGFDWIRTATVADQNSMIYQATSPVVDPSNGNLVIAGIMVGNLRFGDVTLSNPYPQIYLASYSASGVLAWAKRDLIVADGLHGISELVAEPSGGFWLQGGVSIPLIPGHVWDSTNFLTRYNSSGSRVSSRRYPLEAGALIGVHANSAYLRTEWRASEGRTINRLGLSGSAMPVVRLAARFNAAIGVNGVLATAGRFKGRLNLSPDVALDGLGPDDFFIATYEADGRLRWHAQAGGPQNEATSSEDPLMITTDTEGNCYILGFFRGIARFGDTELSSPSEWAALLAKYDQSGRPIWARNLGSGIGRTSGLEFVVTSEQGLRVSGSFFGSLQMPLATLMSRGGQDSFLGAFDREGMQDWVLQLGGRGRDHINGMVSIPDGAMYLGGLAGYDAAAGCEQIPTVGETTLMIARLSGSTYINDEPIASIASSQTASPETNLWLTLSGPCGHRYVWWASDDMTNWTRAITVTNVTGTVTVPEPSDGVHGWRFYRAERQP